ncbi:MAG: hypothetical protein AB7F28_07525 [Candidatus Margulisiibacteriota bacterium]
MTRYSKYSDINAVLTKSNNLLSQLEKGYLQCLHDQNIKDELLVEIKDLLTNLRTALDYLSKKIINKNFPIRNSQNDFNKYMSEVESGLSNIFLKYQPFKGIGWIKNFSALTNENKHVTLVPQKRVEETRTTVLGSNGGSVSWSSGVYFGNGISVMGVPIDPETQLPIPNNIVKTEKITWVYFYFDNSSIPDIPNNLDALPFLKDCFEKIKSIITEIENYLHNSQ